MITVLIIIAVELAAIACIALGILQVSAKILKNNLQSSGTYGSKLLQILLEIKAREAELEKQRLETLMVSNIKGGS